MSSTGEKNDKGPGENEPVPTASFADGAGGPGGQIGPYKLLSVLGEGGFGIVYLAERKKPVRRQVALKVIKPGMDSKQVIARFETERQALALLDHPNIAHVFTAGTTKARRPYFVMEYVKGFPITEYCDRKKLSIEERLELFVQVCEAVQHAHHKGIIHRDLKPSNILVSVQDEKALPKIIDFGVAKAITQPLTERTLFTERGQLIGTPEYMSPEQADMASEDIDTRSDIYSLGVLLYELLSGALPFNRKTLERAGLAEIQRIIREENPPRPSTRLSSLGEEAKKIAKNRHTDVVMLAKRLHKELEWIPLKAMRKERTRRYRSASEFADDIRNYLNDAPLVAGPESTVYRVRKFVRRNRAAVTGIVAVAVALVLGLVVSTAMYFQAEQAREKETVARAQAEQAQARAENAEKIAQEERQKAIADQARAEQSELAVRRQLVRFQVEKGVRLMDEGDLFGSLLRFAEALNLDYDNPADEEIHQIRFAAVLRQCPKLVQVLFHEGPVRHSSFSPDGRFVVIAGSDRSARVWDVVTGVPVSPAMAHSSGVSRAVFSPDGHQVLTSTSTIRGGEVRVWDATTGEPITPPMEHSGRVENAGFSPDGLLVVTTSYQSPARGGGETYVWDARTGQPLTVPLKHKYRVRYVSFGLDGHQLVTASSSVRPGEREVKLWDVDTGEVITPPWKKEAPVVFATFSPDGRQLVAASSDGTAQVWDATTGRALTPVLQHPLREVTSASWSPDSLSVVTYARAREGYEVVIWDVATGSAVSTLLKGTVFFTSDSRPLVEEGGTEFRRISDAFTGEILCPRMELSGSRLSHVDLSADGQMILTAGQNGTVRLWDLSYGGGADLSMASGDPLTHTSFSPDGKRVLTSSWDGTARIWDAVTGIMITPPMTHERGIDHASFSPDGQQVVTASRDGTARIWDAVTGEPVTPPMKHKFNYVMHASFSPDGRRVVTASGRTPGSTGEGEWRIWDAFTGQPVITSPEQRSPVKAASFSPDGKRIVTVSGDGSAWVWDAGTGEQLTPPMKHDRFFSLFGACVSFSPDGNRVVIAGSDSTARVWDVINGQQVIPPLKHSNLVYHASFNPDGSRVLTASEDGTARIWDAATGNLVAPLMRHKDGVKHASFSPDGRLVVTASLDNTSRIWDAATGEAVTPPLRHDGWVFHASFGPDGRRVLTGSTGGDSKARLWDVPRDTRPVDDLLLLARLLASRRIDATGSFTPLETDKFHDAWQALRTKYPNEFVRSTQEVSKQQPRYLEICKKAWECIQAEKLQEASKLVEDLRSLPQEDAEMAGRVKSVIKLLARAYHNRAKSGGGRIGYVDIFSDYEAAVRLDPSYAPAFNDLAWLRATCPAAEFRDSTKAVEEATKACELTGWKNHRYVSTLAVACSEAGDFASAVKRQKEAIDLLVEDEHLEWQPNYRSRLKLYRAGKPYLWRSSTREMVGWWKFDESEGRDVADSSGINNHGTLVGDPQWRPGRVRGALLFDGDGDYVDCGNEPAFDITGSITVVAWIKVNAFDKPWQAIVTKGENSWRLQRYTGDTLEFACTGVNVEGTTWGHVLGSINVNDRKWHHIAGVYDRARLYLYVDGILDNYVDASGLINTNDFPVLIGENARVTGREWNGLIDDVRIYSYALSGEEVKALYTGQGP